MARRFLVSLIMPLALGLASCATLPEAETTTPSADTGPVAKNVILMVSDGIGFNGWLATDYYQGLVGAQAYQITRPDGTVPRIYGMAHDALNLIDETGSPVSRGTDISDVAGAVEQGYDPITRWDSFINAFRNDFPPIGQSYTSYTDSAAAGTAMLTGRKTSNGRINMDWTGTIKLRTIAQIAMDQDKSAGAVSSVMVSHATPAAVISHNISRNNYAEIFNEMVASDLTVIMGAGHPLFDNSGNAVEPEDDGAFLFVGGPDTLTALTSETGLNGFTFIDARTDFEALANGENLPSRVVGIARAGSTLQASREDLSDADTPSGMAYNTAVPDLATMSLGALNVLNQDPDGFFLMVEGGAVDWMGHANNMPRFIEEQIDFNLAVAAVIAWVEENSSWEETLLIVTSDHETGGIWGEGTWINSMGGPVAADRSSEALLAARFDPAEDTLVSFNIVQDRGAGNMPGYQFASRNHTNELVPLWAIGPGSDLFSEFARSDIGAKNLWGDAFNWNGDFIDNTVVFFVMNEVLAGE